MRRKSRGNWASPRPSPREREPILVYPNPAGDVVNVASSSTIGVIEIDDLVGQKLIVQKINSNIGIISISALAKGIYFLKSEDGRVYKLVKN